VISLLEEFHKSRETEEVKPPENVCKHCKFEIPLSEWNGKPITMCPKCGIYTNRLENIQKETYLYAPIPDIKLVWVRFQEYIPFATKAKAWLALGIRDSGKSSLLECLSIRYPKIIDLYGASDMEALCWCKLEFEKVWRAIHGERPRILLVTGKTKDVASKFITCKIDELTLLKIEEHDVITTCHQFFDTEDQYFAALAEIVNILWTKRHYWREPWFVLVREASNWLYSRAKVVRNDNFAKAEFIKAFRESRHYGLAMACDTLRWTALDKEIRDISDFVLVKRLGATGLPDDLRWIYKYFVPYSLMRMHTDLAVISTAKGSLGMMKYDYPSWHKEEHEDILRICGIEVKNVDKPMPDTRNYNTGNFEHAEIVSDYLQTQSFTKTAEHLARSYKTVYNHIQDHNAAIKHLGECKKCFNAKGEYSKTHITVSRAGRPTKAEEAKRKAEAVTDGKAPSDWVVFE
jgi:hypothetical protein